ncbi:MAG: hypothetical protein M1820_008821 [Bogoriella megaspora]|nr:MAG: hypothetical protein M1820_008821 [Bogoriella megaspora]
MDSPNQHAMAATSVKATYNSPNDSRVFTGTQASHKLAHDGSSSKPEQQSQYLSTLRTSTTTLQADINAFLTKKMEEDKQGSKVDDVKDEEKYGEEGAEEEDGTGLTKNGAKV